MNRMLAAERCACELTAAVRNDLVDVHVELGAAPGHPYMQREHVLVVAAKDLVTSARDQHVDFARQSTTLQIGRGSCTLYHCVGSDHLARDQVLTDAEILQGTLGLRAPDLFSRHFDPAQAVGFCAKV